MIRGGAEFQRQKALNQAENNWKAFLGSTGIGLHRIGQAASTGAQSDLMDSMHWGVELYAPTSRSGKLGKTGCHNLGS
jgi:hypothetical protein